MSPVKGKATITRKKDDTGHKAKHSGLTSVGSTVRAKENRKWGVRAKRSGWLVRGLGFCQCGGMQASRKNYLLRAPAVGIRARGYAVRFSGIPHFIHSSKNRVLSSFRCVHLRGTAHSHGGAEGREWEIPLDGGLSGGEFVITHQRTSTSPCCVFRNFAASLPFPTYGRTYQIISSLLRTESSLPSCVERMCTQRPKSTCAKANWLLVPGFVIISLNTLSLRSLPRFLVAQHNIDSRILDSTIAL